MHGAAAATDVCAVDAEGAPKLGEEEEEVDQQGSDVDDDDEGQQPPVLALATAALALLLEGMSDAAIALRAALRAGLGVEKPITLDKKAVDSAMSALSIAGGSMGKLGGAPAARKKGPPVRARQRLALEREANEEADAAAEAESAAANATAAKEAAAAAAAAAALDGLGPLVAALVRVLDVAAGVDVPAALAASKALRELAEDAGARPALAQHGAGTLVLRRCREAEDTAEPAGIALMEDAALTLRQLCEDETTAGALLAAGALQALSHVHDKLGGGSWLHEMLQDTLCSLDPNATLGQKSTWNGKAWVQKKTRRAPPGGSRLAS